MKNLITIIILGILTLAIVGCEETDEVILIDEIPAAPQGVYSVTGDNEVYLYWNGPYESDISGYIIWRSLDPINNYTEVGSVDAVSNPNLDLLIYEFIDGPINNGVTYFYAVSSVDNAGQVSDLSAEEVFDTPRPEGFAEVFDSAFAHVTIGTYSGFSLSAGAVVPSNSSIADIVVDKFDGVFYLNAADIATDIQDVGYTSDSFDDISYAPTEGWSDNGWLEIIDGHTYVIWTNAGHFAKMRVYLINNNSVVFQWAYQTDFDNPELVAPPVSSKPAHTSEYLNKTTAAISVSR